MKRLILAFLTFLTIVSCKKNNIQIEPLASVSIVNAVLDGKVAKLNSGLRDSCQNMDYKHFSILAGQSSQIKVYPSGSPNATYFNQSPNTQAGEIYSLFLTGTNTAPESVLIKESIPPYPSEEVINVRIINLAPGSVPLSLTMGNAPTTNIFSNVSYKQASGFKTLPFPATLPTDGDLFQVRDGAGNLLLTYSMPISGTVSQTSSRKRNITLVIKGVSGGIGNNAFGTLVLPHY